jgi:hypothetical protein
MNQPQLPASTPASPRPAGERKVRHGLIEDWRDALGILLLLFVAAFFGAILSRFWLDGDVGTTTEGAEVDTRLTTIEGRITRLAQSRETTQLAERVGKLENRITAMETAFAALGVPTVTASADPKAAPAPSPLSGTILETAKRLENISTRVVELETKTTGVPEAMTATKTSLEALTGTTTAVATRMDDVSTRLEKLESSDLLDLARRASLASAIANLTRAAQGSSPFRTEYDVVAALLPANQSLRDVAPHAATGLPTTGTLITTFGNMADAALDAESRQQGQGGFSQLWANFTSMVSWRSTAETEGSSTESRLARAEIRLKAGDLTAAVRDLSAIKGAARKPLSTWLQKAAARVKVEAALAQLNSSAIEAITGPKPDGEPVPQLPAP